MDRLQQDPTLLPGMTTDDQPDSSGISGPHYHSGPLPGLDSLPAFGRIPESGDQWGVSPRQQRTESVGSSTGSYDIPFGYTGWSDYVEHDIGYSQRDSTPGVQTQPQFMPYDEYLMQYAGNHMNASDITHQTMHSSGHFLQPNEMSPEMGGGDASHMADIGRSMYENAIHHWQEQSTLIDPSFESLAGNHSGLMEPQPAEVLSSVPTNIQYLQQHIHHLDSINPPYNSSQFQPPVQIQQSPQIPVIEVLGARVNNPKLNKDVQSTDVKPKYSDIAAKGAIKKETIQDKRSGTSTSDHKVRHNSGGEPKSGRSNHGSHQPFHGGNSRKSQIGSGKQSRTPRNHPSNVEAPAIHPDSRYGLDTFEDVSVTSGASHVKVRKVSCQSSRSSSQGSESNPQSRKGSTGSLGSFTWEECGPEETCEKRFNVYDAPGPGPGTGQVFSVHNKHSSSSQASSEDTQQLPKQKTDPKPKPKETDKTDKKATTGDNKPEKLFFDPKRIFANTSSNISPNDPPSSQDLGNDVKPKKIVKAKCRNAGDRSRKREVSSSTTGTKWTASQEETILNNGKSFAPTNTDNSFKKSCYINNDLRDPGKKDTNKRSSNQSSSSGATSCDPPKTENVQSNTSRRPGDLGGRRHANKEKHGELKSEDHNTEKGFNSEQSFHLVLNRIVELAIVFWDWMKKASQDVGHVAWNITKMLIGLVLFLILTSVQCAYGLILKGISMLPRKKNTEAQDQEDLLKEHLKRRSHCGLKTTITLPTTGEEAMKRMFALKGKDPYSILGVRSDVTDEEIKRYYRKQAVLVHPDKFQASGAEEAFKILKHAFELIGEPEKRRQFDSQWKAETESEEAMHQFTDMLTKLQDKMQEAANIMRCDNCDGKHQRVATDRPILAARYCSRCSTHHPALEGDTWAESRVFGFLWHYYACMDGAVYDITEWASCHRDHFSRLQANCHHVMYKVSTNSSRRQTGNSATGQSAPGHSAKGGAKVNQAHIDEFLNDLFHNSSYSQGAASFNNERFGRNSSGFPFNNDPSSTSGASSGQFPTGYGNPAPGGGSIWGSTSTSGPTKRGRKGRKRRQ